MKKKFLELSDGSLIALDRLMYANVDVNGVLHKLSFNVGDYEICGKIKTFDI